VNTQLHLAYGIVEGRAHTSTDRALQRTLELARQEQRKGQPRRTWAVRSRQR
jgi:hypothetical protein